jgi:D-arabinose 1-dehydrogenase-like Zn-dependent alcohol dehydrogenase
VTDESRRIPCERWFSTATSAFALEQANEALSQLREGRLEGAAVLLAH